MKLIMSAFLLCMSLLGCATYQQHSQEESPVSRSVALMPFLSMTKGADGQQAANWIELEFIKKGYVVIDSSFTTSAVSEAKFYESGLSNEVRGALLAQNLTTVVFGSINEFKCESANYSNFYGKQESNNRCTVSLAAKMVDTATGKLLWGLALADSGEGRNLSARDLMKSMINEANIAATLPQPLLTTATKEAAKQPEPAK